jgi:hypothetical protein
MRFGYIREAQSGQILVLERELGQIVNDLGQFRQNQIECITHKDQIGVIRN